MLWHILKGKTFWFLVLSYNQLLRYVEIGSSFMELRYREGLGGKVKCLPIVWETRLWSLGWEDPLENEMATHSSTLAWKIQMGGEAW